MFDVYTREQVSCHTSADDCWVIVDKEVYHLTPEFLKKHPGGVLPLWKCAGTDATDVFNSIEKHTASIREILKKYQVGYIVD